MSMYDWAKREISLAKDIEKQGLEKGEFDYGGACYDSALKAFKSLTKDGHSGMSIGMTTNILNRLIEGKPLTPIEDTDDIWNEVYYNEAEGYRGYQCKRMGSLFKDVYDTGEIRYHDIDAFYCIDVDTKSTYHSHLVQDIINEMYPISMPYLPSSTPIRVGCAEFLTDIKNGDFDTVGVMYVIEPTGTQIEVNRYFKERDGIWTEIKHAEYLKRRNGKVKPQIRTSELMEAECVE